MAASWQLEPDAAQDQAATWIDTVAAAKSWSQDWIDAAYICRQWAMDEAESWFVTDATETAQFWELLEKYFKQQEGNGPPNGWVDLRKTFGLAMGATVTAEQEDMSAQDVINQVETGVLPDVEKGGKGLLALLALAILVFANAKGSR